MDNKTSLIQNLKQKILLATEFFSFGLWSQDTRKMKKSQKFFFVLTRIIATTITGMFKNRVPVQSAALSYTTLLALGPLVAVVILFSSMVFKQQEGGEQFIYKKITQTMVFVMPAVKEVVNTNQATNADGSVKQTDQPEINPEFLALIKKISEGSTGLGIAGSITVIFTCLLLCVNLESAFNNVWGIRKGRTWMMRITFYWMLLTLGVVLGLSGMTFLAGSQLANVFKSIPIISEYASWGTQLIGMFAIVAALAMFYKFMPNTKVKIIPAFVGAFIVSLLLIANNKFSFLYISKIMQQQNFYGYLAIIPISMFSLYIFWMFILTGSQITYAIQNSDFLASNRTWKRTGIRVRQMIGLAVFAEISKYFYKGKTPPTLKHIAADLDIPSEIVRASVQILEEKKLIVEIETDDGNDLAFIPAQAPDTISIAKFIETMSMSEGDADIEKEILEKSPVAQFAKRTFTECMGHDLALKTVRDIIS